MAWHSTHDMLPLLPRLPRRADAGDSMAAKNQFVLGGNRKLNYGEMGITRVEAF